jgi:hypothetical protein
VHDLKWCLDPCEELSIGTDFSCQELVCGRLVGAVTAPCEAKGFRDGATGARALGGTILVLVDNSSLASAFSDFVSS